MASPDAALPSSLSGPFTTGEWEGWSTWSGPEPFETFAGPFYARRLDDGRHQAGFKVLPHHLNGGGAVHGGALMAFADYALFIIATDTLAGLTAVTVSLSGDFVGPGPPAGRLIASGEVVKAGRSLVFIRGVIGTDDQPILSFFGIVKIVTRQASRLQASSHPGG